MTRSLWKGPFSEKINNLTSQSKLKIFTDKVSGKIIESSKTFKKTTEQFVKNKIWSRRSVILPAFLNKQLLVYNGKNFIPLKVSEEMIGHKYGEFASTRKKPIHKKKRK